MRRFPDRESGVGEGLVAEDDDAFTGTFMAKGGCSWDTEENNLHSRKKYFPVTVQQTKALNVYFLSFRQRKSTS